MVRPHIASAMFVLTREALQPYIRPLDCRVLSLRAPMDSAPWCPYHNIGGHYRVRLCPASGSHPGRVALFVAITFMSLRNAWKR